MKTQQSAYEVLKEIVEVCGLDSVLVALSEIVGEMRVREFPDETDFIAWKNNKYFKISENIEMFCPHCFKTIPLFSGNICPDCNLPTYERKTK